MSHDINTRFYVAKVEREGALKKLSRVLYTHCAVDASLVNSITDKRISALVSRSVISVARSKGHWLALIHDFRSDSG